MPRVHAQPLVAVADVRASSRWYRALLDAGSGHGGGEYERIEVDGALVLQLHAAAAAHHHGGLADPDVARGNGVAVWFGVEDLEAAVARAGDLRAVVQTDLHVNPNSGARELWLRDPDGYLVVLAEWPSPDV